MYSYLNNDTQKKKKLNDTHSENPSCLQATVAALLLKSSSQTVPQYPFFHSSRRPSIGVLPFTRRISSITKDQSFLKKGKCLV